MHPSEKAKTAIGKLTYKLGAGGRNPHAPTPGNAERQCDCAGFVCWSLGFDRKQPAFYHDWGWVNTDSMVAEARGFGKYFKEVPTPSKGIVVVYPGIYKDGKRIRIGHTGIVTSNPTRPWKGSGTDYMALRVTHCSAGNYKKYGAAIRETHALVWAGKGSLFLEYQGGLGDSEPGAGEAGPG